jgi:hypothetical protein
MPLDRARLRCQPCPLCVAIGEAFGRHAIAWRLASLVWELRTVLRMNASPVLKIHA